MNRTMKKSKLHVIEGGLPPLEQRLTLASDGYIDIEASRMTPREVQKRALKQVEKDRRAGRNPFADEE